MFRTFRSATDDPSAPSSYLSTGSIHRVPPRHSPVRTAARPYAGAGLPRAFRQRAATGPVSYRLNGRPWRVLPLAFFAVVVMVSVVGATNKLFQSLNGGRQPLQILAGALVDPGVHIG